MKTPRDSLMVRFNMFLPAPLLATLRELSVTKGVTVSELIRTALDKGLPKAAPDAA